MSHLETVIKSILCGIFMDAKEAIHGCMRIDINKAVPSTSSPAGNFGEKRCMFLKT